MKTRSPHSFVSNVMRWCFLSIVVFLAACSSRVALFSQMTEHEANEVYSVLLRAGFAVEKIEQDELFIIQVPQSMAGEALDLLISKGLPRDKKNSINEIFPDDSMISSPLQERARYLYALSQELEKTLMTVDGVIEARVHIVLPERGLVNENTAPSSVAVFVKYEESSLFPSYVGQIRELVVSSIPSISMEAAQENVSIVSVPAAARLQEPLSLTWFGPLAIKSSDRFYLLGLIYLFIAMWVLSLSAVYLSCVEPSRRPAFLQKLLSKPEDEVDDAEELSSSMAVRGKEA